jgi:mitochondrial splicing suppressor protein 51
MLNKAELVPGLLPTWWNRIERERCIDTARNRLTYPNIFIAVGEKDLVEDYRDSLIPVILRILAERIYGKEDREDDGY